MIELDLLIAELLDTEGEVPIELTRATGSYGNPQLYKIWRKDSELFWQLSMIEVKRSGRQLLIPGRIFSASFPSLAALKQELERKLGARLGQGFTRKALAAPQTDNIKRDPLERQLGVLNACGVTLGPKYSIADLLEEEEREEFEANPFRALIEHLATPPDWPSKRYRSPQLISVDFECIYQLGDYTKLLRNFVRIAQGEIRLSEVKETWQKKPDQFRLSFKVLEEHFDWSFAVDHDWIDACFFERLAELTLRLQLPKQWYALDPDCEVFGYFSPGQVVRLEADAGLRFLPLHFKGQRKSGIKKQ